MKKGFTLIELLAVIVILAVISLIAVPRIMDAIDEARNKSFVQNEFAAVRAVENFIATNEGYLPNENGQTVIVELDMLVEEGYFTGIRESYGNCNGHVLVTYFSPGSIEYIPHIDCNNDFVSKNIPQKELKLDMPLGEQRIGNTFFNKVDNNFEGLEQNDVLTVENRFGNNFASGFRTSGSIRVGASNQILTNPDGWSISVWFLANEIPAGAYPTRVFTFHRPGSSNGTSISLTTALGTSIRYMFLDETAHRYITHPINVDQWYHATTTYDGSLFRLFIDGQLVGSSAGSFGGVGSFPLQIGTYNSATYLFNGDISDFKFYNRTLSEQEINHLFEVENKMDFR